MMSRICTRRGTTFASNTGGMNYETLSEKVVKL
jgi:hypothetical protein